MYSTGPRFLAGAAVAAVALALAGCGGAPAAPDVREPEKTEKASAATVPKPAKAPAARPSCREQLGGFVAAMDRLRDRLVAGLSYRQYIGEIKAVRAAYDEVPAGRLRIGCLRRSGTPAEKGFNLYIAAANVWSDCVEVPGCESASVEAPLQRKWRRASRLLTEAESRLSAE